MKESNTTNFKSWPWDTSGANHAQSRDSFQRVALALAANRKPGQVYGVLISAAHQGHGASTAAVAIARELGHSLGLRPLLAELNRVHSCLAERLNLGSEGTVQKMMTGHATLAECTQVEKSGLSVLPAGGEWGGIPVSTVASRILQGAEGLFDIVIFDAPPLLEAADTLAAGVSVGNLVVVVRSGKTSGEALTSIRQQSELAGLRIVGSVLTMRQAIVPRWLDRWLET